MSYTLGIILIISSVLQLILCNGNPSDFDYEIYELIDRLNKLKPEHSTLYDLFLVKPSATPEEISRQFRRLSFPYHPDKAQQGDMEAKKMFTLYSGASQVLKVPESRRRYEWILHEAPPWHRSQVYLIRQLQKRNNSENGRSTGKQEISVSGLIAFLLGFLTLSQLLIQWTRFLLNRYWIWSGLRALKSIPPQELKRMEKKAMRSSLTFLSNVDANFEKLQAARSQPLPIPKPTDLFLFKLPINIFQGLFSILFNRREEAIKKD